MLCPVCHNVEAKKHPTIGVLPCANCQQRQNSKLKDPVEFTSEEIKEQRKQFRDEIIQPFRSNEPSKEYIDKYGYKSIGLTKEQADKAKNVWDNDYYSK